MNGTQLLSNFSSSLSLLNVIEKECKDILSKYYNNSKSHGLDHVREVSRRALEIKYGYPDIDFECNDIMIILAGLFHDIMSEQNREHHETVGAEIFLKEIKKFTFIDILSEEEINKVAEAITQHRASYKGKYSNKFCELMAAADRDKPDLFKIIRRSYNFIRENDSRLKEEEILEEVKKHLIDKFSRDGYMKYPEFYAKIYELELNCLWDDIDMLKNDNLKIQHEDKFSLQYK